ncbi:30S ribosomal protein S20 [Candidatus Margulisiibacteriota bacterium]
MANIKSAKKRIQIEKRNRKRNSIYKNRVKKLVKNAKVAIKKGSEDKKEQVRQAIKWIDKAALKGIIKKSAGARKKSRLMKLLNKAK